MKMLIGIAVLGMLAIGCGGAVVVTATPTSTVQPTATSDPTVTPAPTPTPSSRASTPTSNPVPTTTTMPLPISLLERYEDLARQGIVIREERRYGQDHHGCHPKEECERTYLRFIIPDTDWVVKFVPDVQATYTLPGHSDLAFGIEGYIWAHNYWVHLTHLSRGEVVYWPFPTN